VQKFFKTFPYTTEFSRRPPLLLPLHLWRSVGRCVTERRTDLVDRLVSPRRTGRMHGLYHACGSRE